MSNVTFITVEDLEHAIIAHENGSFTSMLKATYDEMIARETATL